ncbi:MAG: peptidyl-prolyl cis-trans isomerase [Epsilonproteobacteria bacterium]|nr:peptidyl-prolyl cis-trans isomerase [Campylobacterota bacterium]
MKYKNSLISKTVLMALPFVILAGCDWCGCKKSDSAKPVEKTQEIIEEDTDKAVQEVADNSKPLCSIDGRAVITENEFNNSLTQMVQANPYFRGASADSLPVMIKRRFFDELVKQEVIVAHGIKNEIDKREEFIKAYNETKKLLKRSLYVQFFEKGIFDSVSVSEKDVEKYYNENKNRFVKVAGGTLVEGIKFDDEKQADEFLAKAKTNVVDFKKLATNTNEANFKDFGRISKNNNKEFGFDGTPEAVKEHVFNKMSKLPGVDKVKAGKEFWVVKASDKKDAEYFQLAEIKQQVEGILKNNTFREELDKNLKQVQNNFKVNINEDFFGEQEKMEAAQQQALNEISEQEAIATAA